MDTSLSWKWKVTICYLKPFMSLNCQAQRLIWTQAGDIELSHQAVIVYWYMDRKLYLDEDILWGFSFALFHLPIKVNRRQQELIKCEIPLDSDHLEMKFTLTPQGKGHGLFHCQLKIRQIYYQVYKNEFIISTESTFWVCFEDCFIVLSSLILINILVNF